MSRHSDVVRLRHMLSHAREAVALVQGKTRADLARTRLLELGLVRLVEIIGEAAARLSRQYQDDHAEIPWADVVGVRNKLIHGYDTVDLDILWDTVTTELPELIKTLEQILASEERE